MKTKFKELVSNLNIELSEDKIEQFFIYKDILKEWNEKINLTSIVDVNEILIKHFTDSLTIEKYVPQNARVIDVGTGAGFPGIPLKIARPDIELVLLDSLNKRINFLNEVIKKCELTNVRTVHGRAEDFARDANYREMFDISTARAVANLSTLLEYCTPFLKIGGTFICMKADAEQEIIEASKAVKVLNMEKEKIEKFKLPELDADRTIVLYKKINNTPKQFPRKAGIPAKEPIK